MMRSVVLVLCAGSALASVVQMPVIQTALADPGEDGPNRRWESVAASNNGERLVAVDQEHYSVDGSGSIYTSSDFGVTWEASDVSGSDGCETVITHTASTSRCKGAPAIRWNNLGKPVYSAAHCLRACEDASACKFAVWSENEQGCTTFANCEVEVDSTQIGAVEHQSFVIIAKSCVAGNSWVSVAASGDGTHLMAADNGGAIWLATWLDASQPPVWTKSYDVKALWNQLAISDDGQTMMAVAGHPSSGTWVDSSIHVSYDAGGTWIIPEDVPSAESTDWTSCGMSADGHTMVAGNADDGAVLWIAEGVPTAISEPVNCDTRWSESNTPAVSRCRTKEPYATHCTIAPTADFPNGQCVAAWTSTQGTSGGGGGWLDVVVSWNGQTILATEAASSQNESGGLWRSEDAGVTWMRVGPTDECWRESNGGKASPRAESLAASRDMQTIVVASSVAWVGCTGNPVTWSSTDGGSTWTANGDVLLAWSRLVPIGGTYSERFLGSVDDDSVYIFSAPIVCGENQRVSSTVVADICEAGPMMPDEFKEFNKNGLYGCAAAASSSGNPSSRYCSGMNNADAYPDTFPYKFFRSCCAFCATECGECVPIPVDMRPSFGDVSVCVACADGKTSAGGHDLTGGETTCVPTICEEDQHVASHVCVDCPSGKVAGGDASGDDSTCACPTDYYGPSCTTYCAAHTTCSERGTCTADGSCECDADYVLSESGGCSVDTDGDGTANDEDPDDDGDGTEDFEDGFVTDACNGQAADDNVMTCIEGVCICSSCAAGYAGDNCMLCDAGYVRSMGICSATICGEDQHVASHECVDCPSGEIAGGDASGDDTTCACPTDHYGPSCATYCAAHTTCSDHGTCSAVDGSCECDADYVRSESGGCSVDTDGDGMANDEDPDDDGDGFDDADDGDFVTDACNGQAADDNFMTCIEGVCVCSSCAAGYAGDNCVLCDGGFGLTVSPPYVCEECAEGRYSDGSMPCRDREGCAMGEGTWRDVTLPPLPTGDGTDAAENECAACEEPFYSASVSFDVCHDAGDFPTQWATFDWDYCVSLGATTSCDCASMGFRDISYDDCRFEALEARRGTDSNFFHILLSAESDYCTRYHCSDGQATKEIDAGRDIFREDYVSGCVANHAFVHNTLNGATVKYNMYGTEAESEFYGSRRNEPNPMPTLNQYGGQIYDLICDTTVRPTVWDSASGVRCAEGFIGQPQYDAVGAYEGGCIVGTEAATTTAATTTAAATTAAATEEVDDTDTDGDGVSDLNEGSAEQPPPDADNDTVPDYLESNIVDSDGDGLMNQHDPDDDNDSQPTRMETAAFGSACAPDGDCKWDLFSAPTADGYPDTDGDGIPDYLDEDDDGDGMTTLDEILQNW